MMRIAIPGLVLLALSACEPAPPAPPAKDAPEVVASSLSDNEIACALAGAARFTSVCTVERRRAGKALQLIVRHPDGGFRRFDVLTNGRGLAAADGAQHAETAMSDSMLELSVGEDTYLFPARLKDNAQKP